VADTLSAIEIDVCSVAKRSPPLFFNLVGLFFIALDFDFQRGDIEQLHFFSGFQPGIYFYGRPAQLMDCIM
jgi:hypothetical protein